MFEQAERKDYANKVYEIAGKYIVYKDRLLTHQLNATSINLLSIFTGVPSPSAKVKITSNPPIVTQAENKPIAIVTKGGKKPQLPEALKLLIPVAKEWRNIGTILKLKKVDLKSIATDEDNDTVANCLREMLTLWLSQEDPVPSWEVLAEAVEPFSDQVAAKVKSQCA